MLWQARKKSDQTESVIQISQGIDECRVSLLDNVAQCVLRCLCQVLLGQLGLLASQEFLVFLDVRLDLPELIEELVMHQDLQVLQVIVGLVRPLELLLRLSRVDALQNAQSPEILESELELPDCLGTRQVLRLLSLLTLLDLLRHIEYSYITGYI